MKMKLFIGGLYIVFLIAMITGIVTAFRLSEGLVETNYYEKGNGWFQSRAAELQIGLEVKAPESLSTGENNVSIRLSSHGKPLEGADVKLFVGNVSTSDHDVTSSMHETTPGVYQARALIPSKGKWLVRTDITGNKIKTSRSWFYDIR